jgi:hypothetical protein
MSSTPEQARETVQSVAASENYLQATANRMHMHTALAFLQPALVPAVLTFGVRGV